MTTAGIISMILSLAAVWALLITCMVRLCKSKDKEGNQRP